MKHHRVLIVDDSREICELIAKICLHSGHEVVTHNDGKQIKEFCSHYVPDLIFLDIVMPEIDGFEVLHQLAQNRCRAEIVLITGFDLTYLSYGRKLAYFHGLKSVRTLAKPLDLGMLRAIIETPHQKTS